MLRSTLAVLSTGLALVTGEQVFAQPQHSNHQSTYTADELNAIGVTNVPDRHGCVKWCFRDLNPCDPPEFKRADGRCFDD